MDRLEHDELAALRWLLGQGLVLASLAGALDLGLGAGALTAALLGLTLLSCLFPALVERIPQLAWRVAPALLLVFIIGDFILSGGDVLPPLFRMVLLLTGYRALQVRSPREDLQLLLLTLFMLLITGVLSQEFTFGLQLLVFAPLAMGQLFAVNLSTREPEAPALPPPGPVFAGFSWRRLPGRLRGRVDRRTLAVGLLLYLGATGATALMFMLLPRFDIGQSLPFLRLQTSRSLTGFTDHVRYGDVVSILNDDAIAMRVDVAMDDPPASPYWRMVVLDAYYDGGFAASPLTERDSRPLNHYRFDFPVPRGSAPEGSSVWTLYLEGGVSAYLPAGDTFRTLRFRNRMELQYHERTRVFKTRETNATTLSLRYEDLAFGGVLPASVEDLRLQGLGPVAVDARSLAYTRRQEWPQTLLSVPQGPDNQNILEAALRAAGHLPGMPPGEFAGRMVRHLQSGRGYSLETRIPDGAADTLLRWLDSGLPGHCELYAGAMVLLSRQAGYPARMVTGFAGGDWNGFENYFMVRNRHAHAWVELFDPARGWVRVDPTPGYGAAAGRVEAALAGGQMRLDRTWQAYLDSLRILWFRRVIQFDSGDQQLMAESAKGAGLRALAGLRSLLHSAREQFSRDWSALGGAGWGTGAAARLGITVGAAALAAAAVYLLLRVRRRLTFEARIRRRAGRLLERIGGDLPAEVEAWREQLQRLRYGPVESWPSGPQAALRQRPAYRARKR